MTDSPGMTAAVTRVRARQRDLGVPESIECLRQTTPSLLDAVRSSGRTAAQDDAVARVYERVGFARVDTACIAEPSAATHQR